MIFIYLGRILHFVQDNYQEENKVTAKSKKSDLEVVIRNTEISVPFKVKVDNFQVLSKIIVFDSNRNKLITDDIKEQVNKGNRCLVLTERKEHIEILSYYLKGEHEIITLSGDLTEKQKKGKAKINRDW